MDNLLVFDGSVGTTGALTGTLVNNTTNWANPPASGSTYYSVNTLDSGQLASNKLGYGRDIGIGDDPTLLLVVSASVAIIGLANSTLTIAIQVAADNGSGSPSGTWDTIAQSEAIAVGTAGISGEIWRAPIPQANAGYIPKFYRLAYTVGTANLATNGTGAILAEIVLDKDARGPLGGYQSGYSNQYL
jgi:hypothetical protein